MNIKILTLLSLLFLAYTTHAENTHDHPHLRNEIGISVAGAYEIEHQEWIPAIHAHYFRTFTPHSRWAWGGGVEVLAAHQPHFELAAGIRFQPLANLHLSVMPGVTLAAKPHLSIHSEVAYEFLHIGNIHIGALVGYAWSPLHSQTSVGLHISYLFGKQK